MAIEAIAAVAAKEIIAEKAIEIAREQLMQKLAYESVENTRVTQAIEQTSSRNFRIGELSTPEIEQKDLLKEAESNAADELRLKIEEKYDSGEKLNPHEGNTEEGLKTKPDEFQDHFDYDDNGNAYKTNDGELLPDNTYVIGGNEYKTNSYGKITECRYTVTPTPENGRDVSAQLSVGKLGGEDYDGGHIVARENGGASGRENLEPMRATINRGEYRILESDENKWGLSSQNVEGDVKINRVLESDACPSGFEKTVNIDGQERVKLSVDNIKGSTALIDEIEKKLPQNEFVNLKKEISEMIDDLGKDEVSITSLREDRFPDGRDRITIGIRDELAKEKYYKTYDLQEG